jgi:predicted nucleic acid-binding Zn ribbon protein
LATIRVRPRRRKGRPSVQPQKTRNLVAPLFNWLKLDQKASTFRALKAFWDAVSPRIRAHARGERLFGATLYVRVESAAWSHELSILKPALLEKLRATSGGEGVQDLRFTVGPLSEVPDWSGTTSRARQELLEVPEPIPDELNRALEDVADPEMRENFRQLMKRLGVRRRP